MRFTLSLNSGADYDSEDYFSAERVFNAELLADVVEHLEFFLRNAGFSFGHLEIVNEDTLDDEMLEAEHYDRTYINRK